MAELLEVLIGAAVLVVAITGGGYFVIFRRPLPRLRGTLSVAGPLAPVEVSRNAAGVPLIQASSAHDAAFAVGFVHGQDRLWQMEMARRTAAGRLAEVLGESALASDRLMRRLGLRRVSEAEWHVTQATGEIRRLLTAYAEGVNAAMRDRPLPAEFRISRHRPERWEPEDSLAVNRLMGMEQARNWEAQLLRMRVLAQVGPEPAAELLGASLLDELRVASDIAGLSSWASASNSFVVAPRRSATGRPILATDVHAPLGMPGPWYALRINAPDLRVEGMTLPGMPFVVMGHNPEIAWGLTGGRVSCTDLYVEKFSPNNPMQFLDNESWENAVRFREVIRVRGAAPVVEDVLVTRRGPVISPALPGTHPPLSLRWVSLDSEVDSVGWLLKLNRARDWKGFRAAAGACASPSLLLTYADVAGNTGARLAGFVPIRRSGGGHLPTPGWDGRGEWVGFLAFEDVPEEFNPAGGVVVAANGPVSGPDGKILPGEPASPYRAQRLGDLLNTGDELTADACQVLLEDEVSLPGLEFRRLVLEALGESGDGEIAVGLELLRDWDGRMEASSAGAAVAGALRRSFAFEALRPAGPALTAELLSAGDLMLSSAESAGRAPGDAGPVLAAALRQALGTLRAEQGNDPRRWAWGRSNQVVYTHPLGRVHPALRPILERGPFPSGGDDDTVRQVSGLGPTSPPRARAAASVFRAVYDVGQWESSLAGFTPGQSGHAGSRNYADRTKQTPGGGLDGSIFGPHVRASVLRLVPPRGGGV